MNIPFIDLKTQYQQNKQSIARATSKVLEHGQYIMGPEIFELERALANYVGTKHALTCSSGTDALVLSLMSLDLTNDDAVFTSPFTFFASAESITLAGAKPVFVDIDPLTYNIDPIDLEHKIEKIVNEGKLNPRAIIPVDLFGISCDYKQINEIAKKFSLTVLEDAAQAFGAPYHNGKAGGLADIAATSFYPAKPLGCYGDGGAVFTNDSNLYETLVSLRVHGQASSGDKYDNVRIGLNARMDTLQAAILLEKLKVYDKELDLRSKVASHYEKRLSDHVKTPIVPKNQGSVWAQYTIQVSDRDKLKSDLNKKGIPTAVFYPKPIHLTAAYKFLDYKEGDFPITEKASKHVISLPMHPYLESKTIDYICDAVLASITT